MARKDTACQHEDRVNVDSGVERVSTIDKLWLELNAACRQIIRCQSKLNGCH